MKRPIFFIFSFLFTFLLTEEGSAQLQFYHVYSNPTSLPGVDGGKSVQTPDSGYLALTDYYTASNVRSVALFKLDKYGNISWIKMLPTGYYDYGADLKRTLDGGYMIMSTWGGNTSLLSEIGLVKLDSQYNIQWQKKYGGNGGEAGGHFIQLADSSYVFAGATQGWNGFNTQNAWFVKTNSIGDTLWTSEIGESVSQGPDNITNILQCSDGGFLGVGMSTSFTFNYSWYIIKVDSIGNLIWTKIIYIPTNFVSTYGTFAFCAQETSGGNYVIGGTLSYPNLPQHGSLLKVDALGNTLWIKEYSNVNQIRDIVLSQDGSMTISGGSANGIYLAKVDSMGNPIWMKTYSDSVATSYSSGLQKTFDSGYLLFGFSWDNLQTSPFRMNCIKTDSLGNSCRSMSTTLLVNSAIVSEAAGGVRYRRSNYSNTNFNFQTVTLLDSVRCTDCIPHAYFQVDSLANFSFQFTDSSTNTTTWSWNFGDGNTSTQENPNHLYSSTGTYTVCLTVTGPCGSDSTCQIINVGPNGIKNELRSSIQFEIFPNPSNDGVINFDFKYADLKNIKLIVISSEGQELIKRNFSDQEIISCQIDLSEFSNGMYFIGLDSAIGISMRKVMLSK